MLINVTNQKHQGFILIFLESRSEHFQENVLKKIKKKRSERAGQNCYPFSIINHFIGNRLCCFNILILILLLGLNLTKLTSTEATRNLTFYY